MKKLLSISTIAVFIAVMVSCHKNPTVPQGTVVLDLPATPYKYFAPNYSDSTSNYKATLGRVLFYDGHLSLNNTISCASCHKQSASFADNVAFSTGFEGRLTGRNSKGILNIAGTDSFFTTFRISSPGKLLFWDGRENSLVNLVNRPITNHVEMGITDPATLPAKIGALSIYPPMFQQAYGDNNITSDRISECISVFMMSIRSTNSKFNQYQNGNVSALNALEVAGLNLFTTKYQCTNCHQVFNNFYSFNSAKDIGLDRNYTDLGVGAINKQENLKGTFVVPSLFNVALTAPYMHDGRFKTLDDVLEHYSHGINNSSNLDTMLKTPENTPMNMNISVAEKTALIAFLNTLTDYSTVTDVKFSNPFKIK